MACSALFSAASRAASSSSRCLLAVELGLARDQLRLPTVDVGKAREGVLRNRVALRRLLLELLHARGELARPRRKLELALVELARTSHEALVPPVRSGGIRL